MAAVLLVVAVPKLFTTVTLGVVAFVTLEVVTFVKLEVTIL